MAITIEFLAKLLDEREKEIEELKTIMDSKNKEIEKLKTAIVKLT